MSTLSHMRAKLSEDWHLLSKTPKFTLRRLDYDAYWDARGGIREEDNLSIWQRWRVDRLVSHLRPGESVLDLGCGGGGTLAAIRRHVAIDGIGADISEQALDSVTRSGFTALRLDLGDRQALAACPPVDYALAFELLEHLPEPEAMIAALAPRVRKGFWVSFPNTGYWVYRTRLLMGKTPMQWVQHPGEHLRFWTLRDLRWWAGVIDRDLGFRLEHLHVYRGYPGLNRVWPGLFGMAFLFCLVRRTPLDADLKSR
jgi:methionine biosynthesis protein MetW